MKSECQQLPVGAHAKLGRREGSGKKNNENDNPLLQDVFDKKFNPLFKSLRPRDGSAMRNSAKIHGDGGGWWWGIGGNLSM
jgi:hypothetical protein